MIDISLDFAIRLTEILVGFVFIQQCLEHMSVGDVRDKILFFIRLLLSTLLIFGFETQYVCVGLVMLTFCQLWRFQGPYNGGSDRMSHLIIICLCLARLMPNEMWREYIFGYLAIQLILSYVISGWVKIVQPAWRSGQALQDVFLFSAYPVVEKFRNLANYPRLLWFASWAVMVFELLFPLFLISQVGLIIGLIMAATFHLANAVLFGLNRFFWIWICAYPSIVWLQYRIVISL